MSFLDEYNALKHKRKENPPIGSFLDEYNEIKAQRENIADGNIAPVKTTGNAIQGKEDDRKWFEKGAFEDGYQFGDVFKTILGTGQDVHENLFEGVYGIAEKAIDAGAYLVGGVSGLLGADNFRDKTEAFIEKDLIDEDRWAKFVAGTTLPGVVTKILSDSKETDEMSVLGEKSDALVQSTGQLGATIGLQAVGVPWWVTTGVTSFGSEVEGALKEGATYGEAGLSAAITAGAEILTEKISGGIKFGGATLDDVLTKRIARGVSSKVVRTLMKFGMDAMGEGLEEVLSGVMSAVGQRITYADDKELSELFSKEEAWESFIGGAVLGGGSSGVNAVKSKGYGVDPVSNLTTNEQKVVDQEYKNRVSEAEKKGKVTQKQKDAIYDGVIRDMERGYISTDTIEEVLGGETYKTHKDTVESEKAMQEEYDMLYQMKNGDKSDAQIDRQAELRKKLDDIKQNFNRNQLQDEVMSMVKGDRLAESYNERFRRGQAFEADISKYDVKQQATIQKAIDSGILNNTNRTHEFVDMVAKITADKGVLFDFTNNERLKESGFAVDGAAVNGYVTKDGVTLNIDSAKSLNRVVGHEITHVLEGTEMYTALQSVVTEYAKTKGEYQNRYDALAKLYETVEGADIDAELTADLVGDYLFGDTDFVNHLSVTNRNVFQKIYDEIKYLYKIATAGSKEARELERVKKLFEEAYRAETKNTAEEDGVRYALSQQGTASTQSQYAYMKSFADQISDYQQGNIRSDDALLVGATPDVLKKIGLVGLPMTINQKHVGDALNGAYKGSQQEKLDHTFTDQELATLPERLADPVAIIYDKRVGKTSASESNIDVLVEMTVASGKQVLAAVQINGNGRINGIRIDTNKVATVHGNVDSVARLIDAIEENQNGKVAVFYVNNEKATKVLQRTGNPIPSGLSNLDGFIHSITDPGSPVKMRIASVTESQQFKRWFGDWKNHPENASKVVNADGTPKVMYHGSPAQFTVFDKGKAKSSGLYGRGFYFTDSKEQAGVYGNQYSVYLDIKNPLQYGTEQVSRDQVRGFLEAVAENEDYSIENYGTYDVDAVMNIVMGQNETVDTFSLIQDVNATAIGDMVETAELFNSINGTKFDGIIAATETVAFRPEQIKSATDNIGTFDGQNPDIRYSLTQANEDIAPIGNYNVYGKDIALDIAPISETTGKAKPPVSETNIGDMFPDDQAPFSDDPERFDSLTDADAPPVRNVEYREHGSPMTMPKSTVGMIAQNVKSSLAVSDRQMGEVHRLIEEYAKAEFPSRDQLFRELKDKFGTYTEKMNDEAIKDVKNTLRKYRLNVSDAIKSEIADYGQLRRSNFGKVLFSRQGTDVDVAYQELSNLYPGFFPEEITNPTDQLLQIIDVANRSHTFEDSYETPDEAIWYVVDDIEESVRDYQNIQREKDASRTDNDYLDDLVKHGDAYAGDIAPVPGTETLRKTAQQTRRKLAAEVGNLEVEMGNIERLRGQSNADFDVEIARLQAEHDALRDKNTIRANDILRRIERKRRMKNSVDADFARRIQNLGERIEKMSSDTYQTAAQRKVKQQEYTEQMESLVGDTTTWKDKKLGISYKINTLRRNLRDVVLKADGSRDIEKADAIDEELQGKYNHNEAILNKEAAKIKKPYADMKITKAEDAYIQMLGEFRHNPETTLTEDVVKEFYEKHKGKIDTAKVDRAIEMARKTYDELLVRVNQVLKEQGMKEIPYRKGYFPHFTEEKQGVLAKLFNWKTRNNDIPTDIAGLTENFNPNRSWQSFNKERTSDTTDYSFMKGMDTYVQGALDWIHHIEDIQKYRAFENYLRYVHSEQGVKDKIDAIRQNDEYDAEEMQAQIDLVLAEARNPLNNFVVDLRARTNTLANKKSSMDRGMEEATNRKFYSTMTNISNRVSANMVGGSISSALTNFIPITQSWGQVSPVSSLRAMGDTIRSTFRDDGTVAKSDFLTNRLRKADNLYKSGWDKVSDAAGLLMEGIDSFTSQTVWRSKYLENISHGMSESEAIQNADQFAENVLAGRSRGNQPTIFDSKNPLVKTLTAFQLEVANQYGYMFKDMPQDTRNDTTAKLVKGYVTMFLGAYAYNALFSSLTGRDAAFDPIGIIEDLLRDIFGDDEEEKEPTEIVMNFAENIMQEVPFVGGLMGGGRVPISSAMPYDGNVKDIIEGASRMVAEKDFSDLTSEWLKPVYYVAMPVGGGQIKKTIEGLSMFSDDHPIAGSYTKSGNLRFPVDDTIGSRVKAAMFGQWSSKNARDYFDNNRAPLKEKQIQEFIDVDIPIRDYWEYREGLSGLDKLSEKADYIAGLDLPISKKNLLINNIADRKEGINLEGYEDFGDFEEFDFAVNNPEQYEIAKKVGGYDAYMKYQDGMKGMKLEEKFDYVAGLNLTDSQKNALINGETDRKEPIDMTGYNTSDYSSFEEFEFSKEHPGRYGVAKVVGGYDAYTGYIEAIGEFDAKDASGKTVSGLKKERVTEYINGLDLDYGQKIILYRSQYDSKADRAEYDADIFEYLNGRDDISYDEKVEIFKMLGFEVSADGWVTW